ncbi:MAG: response regulator, partial [Deltaproteobacteria bacterium]
MSKILLIDDEESIRSLLSLSLKHQGHEVVTAEDGEKGIEAFQRERPSIVLADIKMPKMDGIEVLKQVKGLDENAEVIVITGHGDLEMAIEALKLDASDFINKPVKHDVLTVAIKRAQEKLQMKQKLREYTSNLELKVEEATEELRKAHDFQQNLIQSSIDGIIATKKDGTIIVFNQGAEKLLGYGADEVIGKMHIDRTTPPGIAETIKKEFGSEAYGGKNRLVSYESILISKSGEEIPMRISGTILFEKGEVMGLVFFFQDLREIKRLEKELIQKERRSAIGQTVTVMAHYIKNILNGLEGGVYMVNTSIKKNKPDLLSRGWSIVEKNINKISDLAINMLLYSNEKEPELEYCSPNDIAEEVFDLIVEKAAQSQVKLVKDFDTDMNECYLDLNGLQHCLLNVGTYAIDTLNQDPQKDRASVVIKTGREEGGIRFDIVVNGLD